MKKLMHGLIATVIFTGLSFGQTNEPSNPKNEFDYVGRIHNDELLKIITSKSASELFVKNPKEYIVNLLTINKIESQGYTSALEDNNVVSKLGKFDNNVTMCTAQQINKWFNDNYISDDIKSYLEDLNLIIEKYYEDLNYNDFKSSIIELEDGANSLKNNDKIFILTTASITRHTVSFWSNNATSLNRYTGTPRGLALADAGGAVAGAIRTYVVCAFTGPVGWGAWCGAVIGTGLGASAMYVITHH